jgi:hypothetical protein
MQGIKQYVLQYDMVSLILLPHGISSEFSPAYITLSTRWLDAIDDYDVLEDYQYVAWQEFILHHGTNVEIENDDWLKGTLLLLMEPTLCTEVESALKSLPVNQRGPSLCYTSSSSAWLFAIKRHWMPLKNISNIQHS